MIIEALLEETKKEYEYGKNEKATNAGALANKLDKNEVVQSALIAHSQLAEQTIVKSIIDYSDSDKQWQRTLAVETSKWVHDKIHGKAIQQNVNVNQNFYEKAKQEREEYNL